MRIALMVATTLLASGCGSVEYKDSNAAVDARPECVDSGTTRPGEPVPPWCKREQAATWSSDSDADEQPLDLSGKTDDE